MAKITPSLRMNILAFDTSTTACTVAIQTTDGNVIESHQVAPMQQARLILPVIQDLLKSAGITISQLDAIAYGCGPGSFTGIRIASSVAQGIAFAANIPVVQISSLAALAQTAYTENQLNKILVAVDARMDEIYWASYVVNSHGLVDLIGQEQLCQPQAIALPEGSEWNGVGDGWLKYEDILVTTLGFKPERIDTTTLPTAKSLLQLAKIKLNQGECLAAAAALPVYLR
jgi:tRNA threonylcarbamoyladenosine biosynthesis protein TsaB